MTGLLQDLRFSFRGLLRRPSITVAALLTLTLAIGASTAIFSVVDRILFRPLPFPEPSRLVAVWADYTRRSGPAREWLSYPNFHDLRESSQSFQDVALYSLWAPTMTGLGTPRQLVAAQVSQGMFSQVLAVSPLMGRGFQPQDDQPGAPGTVLVSHGFWQQELGGVPDAVGRTLNFDAELFTVIGVMPRSFRTPFISNAVLWRPLRMDMSQHACGRGGACFRAVARLSPGSTLERAQAEAEEIGRRLEAEHAEANTGVGFALHPYRQDLVGAVSTPLRILLAAVGFVLLMACVNVANLFLTQATGRSDEIAIRAALGAGARRITRQLLTESLLLAAVGGFLGVLLGYLGTGLLVSLAPQGTPRLQEVQVDERILVFSAAVTILTGLLFGLFPALLASRPDLNQALHAAGRSRAVAAGGRLRSVLVVGQVGLALMLLIGAGLLLRTLQNLRTEDVGFRPEKVLAMNIALPAARYQARDDTRSFFTRVRRDVETIPGLESVALTNTVPLAGADGDVNFNIEGQPPWRPGEEPAVWFRLVSDGYLATMGIPLLAGRDFGPADDQQAPPVVIINENLAERFFSDRSPLGQRINVNNPQQPVWRQIVGVARNIRNFGIRQESRYAMYAPFQQLPVRNMSLVARSSIAPELLVESVRQKVAEIDPGLALAQVVSLDELVKASMSAERFVATLLSVFAVVALLLAAVGVYGVLSYNVSRRMAEMGVRLALGARQFDIGAMVVGRGLWLSAAGILIGLAGALGITRLMQSFLFGVTAYDAPTYGGVILILIAVGLAAGFLPAWRASRADPATVLRSD